MQIRDVFDIVYGGKQVASVSRRLPVEIEMIKQELVFGSAQHELSSRHRTQIRGFLEGLESENSEIAINGFSDQSDNHEYNLALSRARALSAKSYLEELGLPPHRLTHRAFGERKFDGNSPEAQLQRKVVLSAAR